MSETGRVPSRIQRRRTKGWRMPEGAVYVGRPTRWGNPYRLGGPTPPIAHSLGSTCDSIEDVLAAYRMHAEHISWVPVQPTARPHKGIYMYGIESLAAHARRELAGRDLACWCPLDRPCHADVLLRLANASGDSAADRP